MFLSNFYFLFFYVIKARHKHIIRIKYRLLPFLITECRVLLSRHLTTKDKMLKLETSCLGQGLYYLHYTALARQGREQGALQIYRVCCVNTIIPSTELRSAPPVKMSQGKNGILQKMRIVISEKLIQSRKLSLYSIWNLGPHLTVGLISPHLWRQLIDVDISPLFASSPQILELTCIMNHGSERRDSIEFKLYLPMSFSDLI